MAPDSIMDVLDACISDVQTGAASIDQCLARYPQFREELEPLLRITTGIATFGVTVDSAQKAASRTRFLSELMAAPAPERALSSSLAAFQPAAPLDGIVEVLDLCVEDIRAGRATTAECLARYPDLRAELEPLLAVVSRVTALELKPDPARKLAARARFIEALYAEPEHRGARGFLAAFLDQAASFRLGFRGAVSMGLALLLATGGGAAYASEQALPGEPLYPVKLAVEQARVAAAVDEESKAELELEIAGRRLMEVQRALDIGDQAAVQAATAGYQAMIQQADERATRLAERGNDVLSARLEASLDRQQRVLATAVALAPAEVRGSVEAARGHAERGVAPASASSGGAGGGPPAAPGCP
jgi:hypothetical protein